MKNKFSIHLPIYLVVFPMAIILTSDSKGFAQNTTGQRTIHVQLEKNDNGKITSVDTTLQVDDNFDIHTFFKSRGFNSLEAPEIGEKGKEIKVINSVFIDNDTLKSLRRDFFEMRDDDMDKMPFNIDTAFGPQNKFFMNKYDWKHENGGKEYTYKQSTTKNGTVVTKTVKVIVSDINSINNAEGPVTRSSGKRIEATDFSFYPNPGDGRFTLNFFLPSKSNTSVRILDINGKEVYKETLAGFSGSYEKQIDISNQSTGTYFVQILQGDKSLVKKIELR